MKEVVAADNKVAIKRDGTIEHGKAIIACLESLGGEL